MTITLESPAPVAVATPADIPVTDEAVLAIAVRLHDQKCGLKARCYNRDWHALDSFEQAARNFLTLAADARRAGEL